MQPLVPVDTIPQILNPIKEVVSKPQFMQIERLVRGILLVRERRTLEAIRQTLVKPISKGSFNHFLAESQWSEAIKDLDLGELAGQIEESKDNEERYIVFSDAVK